VTVTFQLVLEEVLKVQLNCITDVFKLITPYMIYLWFYNLFAVVQKDKVSINIKYNL